MLVYIYIVFIPFHKFAFALDIYSFDDYCGLDIKTAMDTDPPLLFCSFPSVKDPLWKDHPGIIYLSLTS